MPMGNHSDPKVRLEQRIMEYGLAARCLGLQLHGLPYGFMYLSSPPQGYEENLVLLVS